MPEQRGRERWGPARGATRDGSRQKAARRGLGALAICVSTLAVVAALMLVIVEFSAIASVDVADGSCAVINDSDPALADRCELSGLERNGGAFLLLAVLAVVMGLGAG